MAEAHVRDSSPVPDLRGYGSDDRIEIMADWFRQNFEDPADSLPYESAEGGYQWIWGGPYDAREELADAFPEAEESEIEDAVDRVERSGVVDWSVASSRIVTLEPDAADSFSWRYSHSKEYPHGSTITETILFPQKILGWAIRASFIPGNTNDHVSNDITDDIIPDGYTVAEVQFDSLREIVKALISLDLQNGQAADQFLLERSLEWINGTTRDSELFTDGSIVIHQSPPQWAELAKLTGDGAVITSIVMSSNTVGQGAILLLSYGGARVALAVIKGTSYVTTTFFERLGERIKKGDLDVF